MVLNRIARIPGDKDGSDEDEESLAALEDADGGDANGGELLLVRSTISCKQFCNVEGNRVTDDMILNSVSFENYGALYQRVLQLLRFCKVRCARKWRILMVMLCWCRRTDATIRMELT